LPCGSVISVEPADLEYKNKTYDSSTKQKPLCDKEEDLNSRKLMDETNNGRGDEDIKQATSCYPGQSHDGEDDDLDDFFASLE